VCGVKPQAHARPRGSRARQRYGRRKKARLAAAPEALQQTITLGFGLTHSGSPVNPITIPWAKVNNHKLTLPLCQDSCRLL